MALRTTGAALPVWFVVLVAVLLAAASATYSRFAEGAENEAVFADNTFGSANRSTANSPAKASSDAFTSFAADQTFLPVDEAFQLELVDLMSAADPAVITARWRMAPGYYLYRHQFSFQASAAGLVAAPRILAGLQKTDEFFGDVEVYYDQVEVALPLAATDEPSWPQGATLTVGYQGCADAGLCYPPEKKTFKLVSGVWQPAGFGGAVSAAGAQTTSVSLVSEDRALANILSDANFAYALLLFFIAGIGLAFTPCVFPMLPILSSIIAGEGADISKIRAVTLSGSYVLGMALTYAAVGTLVGLFGAELNLQASLQSPLVVITFALVFVALAGSMFGYYELALPSGLQNWLNARSQAQQGGRYSSVFVMGALSSLVVSPCISAPLAGALIYLSNTGDVVLGGSALFSLGLGMGVPLMLVGGTGGHWLPRAGIWMNAVKAFFGIGLLGVAIWLLERFMPGPFTLSLWALLALGTGVALGLFDSLADVTTQQRRLRKGLASVAFAWGILCLVGAAAGQSNALQPIEFLAQRTSVAGADGTSDAVDWQAVKSVADVESHLGAGGEVVLLDIYADWCISCKTMEAQVFPEPEVAALLQQFTRIRADVTANDEIDQAMLKRYGLFGPPSLVFFAQDGGEITEVRLQGEVDAERLRDHLQQVLAL